MFLLVEFLVKEYRVCLHFYGEDMVFCTRTMNGIESLEFISESVLDEIKELFCFMPVILKID